MNWMCVTCKMTGNADSVKQADIDAASHTRNAHPPEIQGFRAWNNVPIRDVWDDPNVY